MDDIEKRIAEIKQRMLPLQNALGIKSMTIDERAVHNQIKKKQQEEIAKLLVSRPPPKWKV